MVGIVAIATVIVVTAGVLAWKFQENITTSEIKENINVGKSSLNQDETGKTEEEEVIKRWIVLPDKAVAVRFSNPVNSLTGAVCKNTVDGYQIIVPSNYSDLSEQLGKEIGNACTLFFREISFDERYAISIIKGREYQKLNELSFEDYFGNEEFRRFLYYSVGDMPIKRYWLEGEKNNFLVEIVKNYKASDSNYFVYAYTENHEKSTFQIKYVLKHNPKITDLDFFHGVLNSLMFY